MSETQELRKALAQCGNEAGGSVSPECSLEFLQLIPGEVRLKIAALRAELATAREAFSVQTRDSIAGAKEHEAQCVKYRERIADLSMLADEWMYKCNEARARVDRLTMILSSIYALLFPPDVENSQGRFRYSPAEKITNEMYSALSERIRSIPDEIRT